VIHIVSCIRALTFENSCRLKALSSAVHYLLKTYCTLKPTVYRVNALSSAVKEAKSTAKRKELLRRYGHSKYSMARAKTRIVYESEAFQMLTAFIIMLAFVLDMCEAQVPKL
jgi:hypothetical protein